MKLLIDTDLLCSETKESLIDFIQSSEIPHTVVGPKRIEFELMRRAEEIYNSISQKKLEEWMEDRPTILKSDLIRQDLQNEINQIANQLGLITSGYSPFIKKDINAHDLKFTLEWGFES